MSTQVDFYSVDETPVEGDPTKEEMMPIEEMASVEKRMLDNIRSIRCRVHWQEVCKVDQQLAELEAYFGKKQAGCSDCGMHWEACCCPAVDPFEAK